MNSSEIIKFWFEEIDEKQWWRKDPLFDRQLGERFAQVHAGAQRCELFEWRSSAHGRLAEIIVLDQFSRNIYRDTPLAFANDPLALALAQEAVLAKADLELGARERAFFYMPYMHSESLLIHETAKRLFQSNGTQDNLEFELRHKKIIERFGRYPHRNAILGRTSTPDEAAFLETPGSSF